MRRGGFSAAECDAVPDATGSASRASRFDSPLSALRIRPGALALPRHRSHIPRAPRGAYQESSMVGFLVLLAIVVIVVFWIVSLYNRLVGARNGYKNAFAQIDVQLKRGQRGAGRGCQPG